VKIKVKPEEFIVEELINIPIAKKGPYTVLQLQKRYWNTLDVIDYVARKLSVPKRFFSRAGLKDRYSLSTQYLTFRGALNCVLKEKNFTLIPIGKTHRPILPRHMKGNSFSITIRSLNDDEIDRIYRNYPEINRYGVPNFFDEQRFGSARHGMGFFAKALVLKHYRGALKLLLCHSYKEDNKEVKAFKKICLQNWGKWRKCLDYAPHIYRKIIKYLIKNPKDYKNAIKTIDRESLNIYLLAYQSFIFNQIVNYFVAKFGTDNLETPYRYGHFLFYRRLKNPQMIRKVKIPMIDDKVRLKGVVADLVKSVLNEEGIKQKDFALGSMRFRGVRFKSFLRPLIITPRDFYLRDPKRDEIYTKRKKIRLKFTLPPGSYATLLIKRLLI
jgi:tRNA pseudouridine13 synthase